MAEVGVQGWGLSEQPWYRAYDPSGVVGWGTMSLAGKTVHTSLLGPCGNGQGLPTLPPATSAPNFGPCHSFLFLILRLGARYGVGTPAGPLAPLLAELKLIHGPHSPLLTLHSHEALVQAQVVANGILPGCRVVSEEGEHACEPVIDLIECPLLFRSL